MKIAYSSTVEQEETIEELLEDLRYSILPLYISEQELLSYDSMGLLQFNRDRVLYNGTLKEAFQVMTALQTVITIIEHEKQFKADDYLKYEQTFSMNADLLNDYGLFFPFNLQCFESEKSELLHNSYTKPYLM